MPGAFSNDFTTVNDAEADAVLTEVGSLKTATAANDDYKIQGTNAITYGLSSGTGVGTASTLGLPTAASDLSAGGPHFYQWIKCFTWPSMAAHADGGQRVSVSSDAPPTAIRSVLKATVTAGGTGYTVNDELTLVGGTQTQAAVLIVTAVSGGVVTAVTPKATARGMYTVLPTNAIATTGGTGTGCTLNIAGTGNPPTGWIYGLTNNKDWFVGGADTVLTDGWVCYVVEVNGTPDLQSGTPVMTSVDRMGATATIIAASKVATHAQDISRYGTGITVNDGTSGSPVTIADFLAYDNANTRALGVVLPGILLAGKLKFGTTGQTAVTVFKEANKDFTWQGFPVNTSFYAIVLAGAASFVTTFQLGLYSGGLASGGVGIKGANRYTHYAGVATGLVPAVWTLDASASNTLCYLYGCRFSELKNMLLRSDSEVRVCSFYNFGDITANGALFDSCTFLDLRTTTPISATYAIKVQTTTATITNCKFINCAIAVFWDRNADTDTKLDGTEFISGGTGHAMELGSNTPTTITLTDVSFTGYGGTPGSNPTQSSGSTDAAIYNNSGKTITINIVGGTTPAIRNGAGATTVVVADTVTLTVTAIDVNTAAAVVNARVLCLAAAGGDLPADETVTISRSGSTATVAHTGHGLSTGNQVRIKGAVEYDYNGIYTITVTGVDAYTYAVANSPSTPATGTILSSCVLISALTNASGVASDTRTYSADQPVTGTVKRGGTTSPYKSAPIAGTVASASGGSITISMIPDA